MSQENEILIVNKTSLKLSPEEQKGIIDSLQAKVLEETQSTLTQENIDALVKDFPYNS